MLKTLLRRLVAVPLILIGGYVLIVAVASDEPWAKNVLVRYGGAGLGGGIACIGLGMWQGSKKGEGEGE